MNDNMISHFLWYRRKKRPSNEIPPIGYDKIDEQLYTVNSQVLVCGLEYHPNTANQVIADGITDQCEDIDEIEKYLTSIRKLNLPYVAKWENYRFQKLHFQRGQKFIDRVVKYNFEVSHKFGKRKLTSRPRYESSKSDGQKSIDTTMDSKSKVDYFDYDDAFEDRSAQLKTLFVEV
jgi:hypothetical protein